MREQSKKMQNLFSECVSAYMTTYLKQVDILEGLNILEKQGNHSSKTYNRFTQKKQGTISIIQKTISKPQKEKETKKKYKINGKTIFKLAINIYLSTITPNVNGLNAPIKRHRVVDWTKKKTLQYVAYKRPTLGQRTHIV